MLFLEIRGRVDSMNAPKLLAFWEKTVLEEAVSSITIDCKDLDYISSVGLRVFLMMHKGCENGVKVTNANESVKEILSQTGLDSLFLRLDS